MSFCNGILVLEEASCNYLNIITHYLYMVSKYHYVNSVNLCRAWFQWFTIASKVKSYYMYYQLW